MAQELGKSEKEISRYKEKAAALKENINKYFWIENPGKYAYLILNNDKVDSSQEAAGIAYALLFNINDSVKLQRLINNTVESPYGIACVYPHFPRFNDSMPGRHNNIVWPMPMGFWADGAVKQNHADIFVKEMETLAHLALDTNKGNGNFMEIYNILNGKPDGGWQCDIQWKSCRHQTWSATAFIRMVINGMFGLDFTPAGINFMPSVPENYEEITLSGLSYRNMKINVTVSGSGSEIKDFKINNVSQKIPFLPAGLKGYQDIYIEMKEK